MQDEKKDAPLPSEETQAPSPEEEDADLNEFQEYMHGAVRGLFPVTAVIFLLILGFLAALFLWEDFRLALFALLGIA